MARCRFVKKGGKRKGWKCRMVGRGKRKRKLCCPKKR